MKRIQIQRGTRLLSLLFLIVFVLLPGYAYTEMSAPETSVTEIPVPETSVPETFIPEMPVPEASAPETFLPEIPVPQIAPPEMSASVPPKHPLGITLADRIVAVVNGEPITQTEVVEMLNRMLVEAQMEVENPAEGGSEALRMPPGPPPTERSALDLLIERKIQVQLARQQGVTVGPLEIEEIIKEVKANFGMESDEALDKALTEQGMSLNKYKEFVQEQQTIMKLINQLVKTPRPSENEVLTYYQNHPEEFSPPGEVHLRQILLKLSLVQIKEEVVDRARGIATWVRNGGDFSTLAKQLSEGPEAEEGGDLGFVMVNQMLPEVQDAIAGKGPGDVTNPVETPAGIHLFFVEEVRVTEPLPFDQVKDAILNKIYRERNERHYQEWLKQIRRNAQVDVRL